MEILIEIILELYLELMAMVVPKKNATKGMKVLAVIIAIVGALGLPILFFEGSYLWLEKNMVLGIILMIVSAFLVLAQIIAGIVLYKKHH